VHIALAKAGEGPALVRTANGFTHLELEWDSAIWRHWFQALADGRTLVLYDPRGSGLPDRNVDNFSLDAWVSDLEAVVDAAGLQRFPLIGLCQGGGPLRRQRRRGCRRDSHRVKLHALHRRRREHVPQSENH
jgi:hypothetical protein